MGKYIGIFGSFASIISLFFINAEFDYLNITIFVFGLLFLSCAVVFEIKEFRNSKPLKFDRKGNNDYMKKIISNSGKIIVFAGDLSWVDSDEIKQTLLRKGNDLSLCVKKTARYIDEFKAAGVNVYTYNDDAFSPKTRFTIIRPESPTETIAITAILDGHNKEKRYVYEITHDNKDYPSKWIMYAAKDLFNLVKLLESEVLNVHKTN